MQVKCLLAFRRVLAAVLACIGVMSASTPLFASPLLYGLTQDDHLLTINTTTAAATLVGSFGSPPLISPIGLAWRSGSLYTFDGNAGNNATEVMRLNPTTAAVISTLGVGLTGTTGEGDLAFNSAGIGYVAATGLSPGLYSFDITSLSSSTIKKPDTAFDGIAFNASDVLYGLQQGGANLYTLDPATGIPTLVGATQIPGTQVPGAFSYGGLTFGSDGTLYGVLATNTTSNLYSFNLATGAGTLIGAVTNGLDANGKPAGVGKLDGLAYLGETAPPPPVPEPATLLMMGSGLGLGYWRRRHALKRRGPR